MHRVQVRTSRPMTTMSFPGLWPMRKQRRRRIAAFTVSGSWSGSTISRATRMSALVSQTGGQEEGRPVGRVGRPLGGTSLSLQAGRASESLAAPTRAATTVVGNVGPRSPPINAQRAARYLRKTTVGRVLCAPLRPLERSRHLLARPNDEREAWLGLGSETDLLPDARNRLDVHRLSRELSRRAPKRSGKRVGSS